jgi:hypothetical protein
MPTRGQLLISVAVLVASLLAMNVVVRVLTRNSVPRRVLRHARELPSASVMALGNSLVAAGFSEAAYDSAAGLSSPRGSVNLGLGSSSPVEQLLILRYALAHGTRPNLVVYGFYDFQLTEPNEFSIADIIGNRAMLYYDEPLYARGFYTLSRHDAVEFRALHSVPMFADRGAIWAKVEILRRAMGRQGMPAERTNQFGRASDFSLLESVNAEDFRQRCESSVNSPLSAAVGEILRQGSEEGRTVALVEMPMRGAHRSLFYDTAWWSAYVEHVRDLLAPYQVTFVDASHWISDDSLFADPLHLNDGGATEFSQKLGAYFRSGPVPVSVESAETMGRLRSLQP